MNHSHIQPTVEALARVNVRLLLAEPRTLILYCAGCGRVFEVPIDETIERNWYACGRRRLAAVLLAAVRDARRHADADALAWLASDCAQPWADVREKSSLAK